MKEILYGRELLLSEIPAELQDEMMEMEEVEKELSYFENSKKRYCRRCGALMVTVQKNECFCQKTCAYCRNCLKMGKVRACEKLYHLPEPNDFKQIRTKLLKWQGELSTQQDEASKTITETIRQKETRLLWAVTGAGKTEMLFAGIEWALLHNQRVGLASPRVDVVLELAPRLKAAFPKIPIAVLYGDMEEPYAYTQLVLATTHQLFRFREAFDVLIIDEIDAFPFHMDETLQYAANKARKEESALIYLSATPDEKMQKEIAKKKMSATILPARYHGYALPVPQTKFSSKWRERILKDPLKTPFGQEVERLIQQKKRFLVFVPNVEWMLRLEKTLRHLYPQLPFASVSAKDPERKEKVMQMRKEDIQFLLTSTILERGITFPNIDVLVVGAEDRIFTESALVQIAGRAGRSPDYPTGNVIFYHEGQSLAMKKAIRQIKRMNQLARKKGLIK